MNRTFRLLSIFALATVAHAETLGDLKARIDQAAGSFRGMTAKIVRLSYTAVIKDSTEEKGSIAMKIQKPGTPSKEMQVRVDFTSPDEKSWSFRGRKAEQYIPKLNTVQEYDLGKHSKLVDQFLLLGFGASSRELDKTYDAKLAGEEPVGDQKCSKLELIPKSEEARVHLKKVEIWFPLTSGYPVQQKFFTGGGDYMLVSYLDMKLEPNLPDPAVRLKLPANVKREYPQK